MAKIYETQADFEKDKLKEQAQDLRLGGLKQDSRGLIFIAGGWIMDLYHERKPETRGWLKYFGRGLTILGIIEVVHSWITNSKAHTLELQRERMGPEMVVLPPGVDAENGSESKRTAYSQSHGPKTLLEQADKSCDCPLTQK